MTYRILVTDPLGDEGMRTLGEAADVELMFEPHMAYEELVARIGDFDALIVRSGTKVTSEVIDAAASLTVIGRAGVGVDNVDVEAATRRGIAVTNTPDSNTTAAVEQTIALMLGAARHTPHAHGSMLRGEWSRSLFVGIELGGKTLGIIGFGRVGRRVGSIAQALGMTVVAYDPYVSELIGREHDVTLVELNDLLASSDIVTLHMAAARDGRPLIDRDALAHFKQGAILVNAARGSLIDEKEVAAALDRGQLRAAALDVYHDEPPGKSHPLVGHPKVIHTPHLGASTEEAQADVSAHIADQVLTILRGEGYPNSVNIALADDPMADAVLYLAERIGRIQVAMADESINRVEIEVTGDLSDALIATAATGALKGILDAGIQEPVNHVNAPVVAAEQGIAVATGRGIGGSDYPNLLTCRVHFGTQERTISGVVFGGDKPRIVRISRFHLDARPQGTVLLLLNDDTPGVIGKVGTTLGRHGVNIAEWRLGREEQGGTAISFINLDSEPSAEALAALSALAEVSKVCLVSL